MKIIAVPQTNHLRQKAPGMKVCLEIVFLIGTKHTWWGEKNESSKKTDLSIISFVDVAQVANKKEFEGLQKIYFIMYVYSPWLLLQILRLTL